MARPEIPSVCLGPPHVMDPAACSPQATYKSPCYAQEKAPGWQEARPLR
jgi:hypothetical protein